MANEQTNTVGVPVEIEWAFDFQDGKGVVNHRVRLDFDESISQFRIIASELGEHSRSVEWAFGQRQAAAIIQLLRAHIHDVDDD